MGKKSARNEMELQKNAIRASAINKNTSLNCITFLAEVEKFKQLKLQNIL